MLQLLSCNEERSRGSRRSMDSVGSMSVRDRRCLPSPCDRVWPSFVSPATSHRSARVACACTELLEVERRDPAIYATDRGHDLAVRSVHYRHRNHRNHQCRNSSRAMASAFTWPRCAFAWKSKSLNKLLASVNEWSDATGRLVVHPRGWLPIRKEDPASSVMSDCSARAIPRLDLPTRKMSADREYPARSDSADRRVIAWLGAWRFCGGLGPRPRRLWRPSIHDYVAPRLLFVLPLLCSCPAVGLGGLLLLFNLATLR